MERASGTGYRPQERVLFAPSARRYAVQVGRRGVIWPLVARYLVVGYAGYSFASGPLLAAVILGIASASVAARDCLRLRHEEREQVQ
jgi:hypothetical protein